MPVSGWIQASELAGFLRINDSVEDIYLEGVIAAAQTEIEAYCGWAFADVGSSTSRVYAPMWCDVLYIDPASTVTAVETDTSGDGTFNETWSSGDWQLEPLNQIRAGLTDHPYYVVRAVESRRFPLRGKRATVRVTGTFGWATRPPAVVQALLMHAGRLHERRNMPAGIAAGDGFATRTAMGIDPDVKALLDPYRRVDLWAS